MGKDITPLKVPKFNKKLVKTRGKIETRSTHVHGHQRDNYLTVHTNNKCTKKSLKIPKGYSVIYLIAGPISCSRRFSIFLAK